MNSRLRMLFQVSRFISLAMDTEKTNAEVATQLPTNSEEWMLFFDVSNSNSVLSNICALLCERPDLLPMLPEPERSTVQNWYNVFSEKCEIEKTLLVELDNALASHTGMAPILLKGSVRLFDNLYPTPAHRFKMDIDLYYPNREMLNIFKTLGYTSTEPDIFALGEPFSNDLEALCRIEHHLPAISKGDDSIRIELHHRLVDAAARTHIPAISDVTLAPCPTLDHIRRLSLYDEFNLAFANTYLCDQNAPYGGMRLRGILETALLYENLTPAEQDRVQIYAKKTGHYSTLMLASLIGQKLLGRPLCTYNPGFGVRVRYAQFLLLKSHHSFVFFNYSMRFTASLFTKRLWDKHSRSRVRAVILDRKRWAVHLDSLFRSLRR